MLVGVPKEIKDNEYRVGLVPASVRELTAKGHGVLVQTGAGLGAGLTDAEYEAAGAKIVASAEEIFANAELVVKVKEPLASERKLLRRGQILFTYLHLAPDPQQTNELIESGVSAIAYETVTSPHGGLPLLMPMSEVAGRMASSAAASPERMRRLSLRVSAPTWSWSIAVRRRCAASRRSSATGCARSTPRVMAWRPRAVAPISSSALCWCRARLRPSL
jgi:alanine dehydrogenase